MIPVTQTKVVVKNKDGKIVVEGNCYAAIIASLLEVPITEVPNVEIFFDDTEHMFYEDLMKRYLKNKGLKLIKDNRFKIAFHVEEHEDKNLFRKLLWDKYYIATGNSPRGFCHVCIFKNGQLVHDPHPSKDGIENPYEFETIETQKEDEV
jgi:hypothetical protein